MPSFTVNICVLAFVLLSFQHTCHSKPHRQSKREIVKDNFNPTALSPKVLEKSEDDKYHLKKEFHRMDSEVIYAADDKNNIVQSDLKAADVETTRAETETVLATDFKNEPLKDVPNGSENLDIPPDSSGVKEAEVEVAEEISLPKSETIREELSESVEINDDKAPFTPMHPEFLVPAKPDSKDEIAVKTNLPPISEEEKVEEKVSIGQVPHFYPRIIPIPSNFRLPILIPVHQMSYGSVSVLPLPPSYGSDRLHFPPVEASDRLPFPFEDDIVGEDGPEPTGDGEKEPGLPLGDPYVPALPFTGGFLKDLKEAAAKHESEKQTKIVDVLGKKFLMQSNVMKYPRGDHGNTYVRFMSVKPLEASLKNPKEVAEEKATEEKIQRPKEMKELDAKKTEIMTEEDGPPKKSAEAELKREKETEKSVEHEILKAAETQIKLKVVPKEMADPEVDFKKYEDPYVKGIEDIIKGSKKHSFVDDLIPLEKREETVKKSINEELEQKMGEKELGDNERKEKFPANDEKENNKKKNEGIDSTLKGETKTDMEKAGKEEIFLDSKKKQMDVEGESAKPKNNIERKKKEKCKCEEKDGDSDSDVE